MTIGSDANSQRSRVAWILFAAILGVATIARFTGLSARPMFDEAASWTFVTLPWKGFLKVLWVYDGNMTFYYLLLRGWVQLGDSEIVVRSLSVLFGIGAVGAIYALGKRLFNARTGLIAALFLAVHAFHIQYSQEARSYSLATFLLILSTLLFINALNEKSRRAWTLYVVVSALSCYSQILAVLVLGSQWLWLLGVEGFGGLKSKVRVLFSLAAATLPIGIYAVIRDGGQIDWIRPLTRYNFLRAITTLAGGSELLLMLLVVLCALAIYFAVRHRSEAVRTSHTVLLLIWALLPPAVLAAVSMVRPFFVDRYLLMCVPAALLLCACALDRMLSGNNALRVAGALIATAVLTLSTLVSVRQYQDTRSGSNPLRQVTQHLLENQQPDDGVIFYTSASYMSFKYYATRSQEDTTLPVPRSIIPDDREVPTGAQPIPTAAEVKSAVAGSRRVWVVLNKSGVRLVPGAKDGLPVLETTLNDEFQEKSRQEFEFLTLCLYERKNAALSEGA